MFEADDGLYMDLLCLLFKSNFGLKFAQICLMYTMASG